MLCLFSNSLVNYPSKPESRIHSRSGFLLLLHTKMVILLNMIELQIQFTLRNELSMMTLTIFDSGVWTKNPVQSISVRSLYHFYTKIWNETLLIETSPKNRTNALAFITSAARHLIFFTWHRRKGKIHRKREVDYTSHPKGLERNISSCAFE